MKTINYKNKTITFIPTAHVSKQSIIDVQETIQTLQPDAVCVELDDQRAKNLLNPKLQKDIDIKTILKEGKLLSFLANLILSSYQKKMASGLDTQVGGEMTMAINEANAINANVYYIDRDINVTLKRLWSGMSFTKKISLLMELIESTFSNETFDESDIEQLKQSDLLYEAVKELDSKYPEIAQQILHERNQYMAEQIKHIDGDNIVVVIGAAHLDGIIDSMDNNYDLEVLSFLPEKKKNYLGWIFTGIMVALLIILTLRNPSVGLMQLLVWFGLASGLALLGCIISGASIKTYWVAIVSAPLCVLSPVLATGIFTGMAQANANPPTMSDFETVSQDIGSLKGWYSNKLLKVLLVALATNLLASISTIIAGSQIIIQLFK